MFGFGATRKSSPVLHPDRPVGLDVTASRARAVAVAEQRIVSVQLEVQHEELPFVVQLGGKPPLVGSAAEDRCRQRPHATVIGALGRFGQSQVWRDGRHSLNPESAAQLCFDRLRPALANENAVVLALPAYLTAKAVKTVLELAALARLPIIGSVAAPLAVVAHRAGQLGPGATALVFDADDYALSATLVTVGPQEVRFVASTAWPQASVKLWKDRLIDGVADRCVRVCRRDPRDSAEAEQGIFDQLDSAMEGARQGRPTTFSLRCEHWYQDVLQSPDDLERSSAPLLSIVTAGLGQFLLAQALAAPPRAIWFSHAAARLPGLMAKMYRHTSEHTALAALPANAAAEAAAVLAPRFADGTLPKAHVEAVLPWNRLVAAVPLEAVKPARVAARKPAPAEAP